MICREAFQTQCGAPKRSDGTQRRCVSASSRLSAARGIVYSASSARRDFFSISSDTDAHSPAEQNYKMFMQAQSGVRVTFMFG